MNANNKNGESIMIELLMGMGFGSTVGYYTNNLGLGIVLGSFIGIVIGMFKIKRNKKYEQ
ncbi:MULTISPECIES: septum formation initiator [Bacillus]|uniref:septum formation initiator n=1 Tax=Bacillus TaxID=1386 RepID=UPI0013EE4F4A|nr:MULTISPECIES: septum formation initiator [Bacillus]KAF6543904.1 septum formation initiator [Bacillus sp. EKM202B]MCU5727775.1 septum formation initiator [Bacillus toyonensis]